MIRRLDPDGPAPAPVDRRSPAAIVADLMAHEPAALHLPPALQAHLAMAVRQAEGALADVETARAKGTLRGTARAVAAVADMLRATVPMPAPSALDHVDLSNPAGMAQATVFAVVRWMLALGTPAQAVADILRAAADRLDAGQVPVNRSDALANAAVLQWSMPDTGEVSP